MLQQTQVATVVPYFERFVAEFPDVATLAAAPVDQVLRLWAGLGYYSRARNLHRAARLVVERHGGAVPIDAGALAALPGVGRSTAAAIAVFAGGARAAILDGNVKRVLARHRGIAGYPGERAVEGRLWEIADALLPARDDAIEQYTQGLMDLGATLCTRTNPGCERCPVGADCVARLEGRTAELPSPRPRRQLPHRAIGLLVVVDRGEVLLERRPPSGIWGGLWSLPEFEVGADAEAICRERFAVKARTVAALPPVEHGFTHFRLTMHPVQVTPARAPGSVGEPGVVWLALSDAQRAALPAPIRRLIAGLDRQDLRKTIDNDEASAN
jgi:A/G-specific adenine glycosylase